MEKMTLARVAALIGSGAYTDHPDTVVEGLSADSRSVSRGSLFIPLVGARFDGHDYIDSAYASGAAAAITHKSYSGDCPTVKVYDTMSALTALAAGYRASFSPIVTGITGSVGKTTTKELTAAVMSRKYTTHKTQGNKNNEIGLPLTLMQLESRHGAAVIEMGMSDFGEISRLSRLARPDIAVITNVGTSHIEFLGSREGIARAKSEIAEGMTEGSDIIIPSDEPLLKGRKEFQKLKIHTFGLENADYTAQNVRLYDDGSEFDICFEGGSVKACLRYAGRHNVLNALAAFAAGISAGVAPLDAAQGLYDSAPEGVRQRIYTSGGYRIYSDCYNANPESVKVALDVLGDWKGRRIAVLGDMLELGDYSEKAHREVGVYAAGKADILVVCGGMRGVTASGAAEGGMSAEKIFTTDSEAAASLLKELSREGDMILFKGSRGMKMEKITDEFLGEATNE
ncbi:MAG: UDP-N-acetylmuramoyl-tripeptide--D-alanyl-D-alanine ligase [Clostridia bacterium]|nr:UDP-N-acetylmuramoyl-tripeptide--D-alanyl-D-alanine ligase [Clostridia bacterium]